jgi:hypothetical protein
LADFQTLNAVKGLQRISISRQDILMAKKVHFRERQAKSDSRLV